MKAKLKSVIIYGFATLFLIFITETKSKAEIVSFINNAYKLNSGNYPFNNYQLNKAFNDSTHKHHESPHHPMFMTSIGLLDKTTNFYTVGLEYQYRLPFFNRLISPGIMGMLMIYPDNIHFMANGTISFHPYKEWFILTEYGMTHKKYQDGKHEMAPMFGVGLGHHFMLGNIMIAPIIIGEYSRLQHPVYSIAICLSYHKKCTS